MVSRRGFSEATHSACFCPTDLAALQSTPGTQSAYENQIDWAVAGKEAADLCACRRVNGAGPRR